MRPSIGENSNNRAPTSLDSAYLSDKYALNLDITLSNKVMAANKPNYSPNQGDAGKLIKIQIELMADGECVHNENGAVTGRHSVKLKN